MKTDIFLRSYKGDFRWLQFALASLAQRARGFGDVLVCVPKGDEPELATLTRERIVTCPRYHDDYIGQQVTKMMADTYTDAAMILHWDSDVVLLKDLTPQDLMSSEGKPVLYYDPYSEVKGSPWRPVVKEVLGWDPEHEFMRRHPFMYPRWLYAEVRRHIEHRHGKPLEDYALSRPHRSFSEFNILGAYAWQHCRDEFTWLRPDQGQTFVKQFWSWGGVDQHLSELNTLIQAQ